MSNLPGFKVFEQVRKHARRAAWAVAEQGINPLVQLALTPFLLVRLGRLDFGLWTLGIAVLSMSQLISFGAGAAATKHVSADLGAGVKPQAIAALRGALTIASVGGFAAAILAWAAAPFIATHFFANMGRPEHIAPVLALCGLAAAVQEIDNVFAGAMRGAERFDLCAKVEVAARVVIGCVLVYLAERGAGVRTLFLALIEMMACKAALKAWQAAVLFGDGTCWRPSVARPALERVLRFGVWQWVQSAGSIFFSATDQLLIGGLLGAAALTRYGVCLQIAQYVHMLPSVMMQIIFPRLSALGRAVDARRGNEILRSATLLGVGGALLLGVPAILMARPLLTLWIGPVFAAQNQALLVVLVLVHIALAFNVGAYFVLLGTGRAARSAGIILAAGAAQSAFAVIAAPFGILAVACNRFIYSLLTALLYKAARYKER